MEVTKEASEKYLYGNKNWNATTIKTTHTYLTTLFNFAIKEGYATLNPFAKVQRTKRIASTAKDRVLPVGAVQALLQYALDTKHYAECASYVLTFFCGVRSEEVTRVKWEDIKLDEEKPVVVVDYPKIAHQRRINALPENAIAWLRLCNDEGKAKGIVAPDNYNQRMMRLRRRFYRDIETQREYEGKIAAGKKVDKNDEPAKLFAFPANTDLSYHQNSARICFASYHIAFHEDAAKTSMLLGHQTSSALLYTTYRALVTKAEAEKYWKIVPGKDVTIPTPIDRAAKGKRLAAALPADAPAPVLALPAPVAAE